MQKKGLELLKKLPAEKCENCVHFRTDVIRDYFGKLDPNVGFCGKFSEALHIENSICHYFERLPLPKPENPKVTQTELF